MKKAIKELESIRNEIQQAAGEVVDTYDKIDLWWIRGKTPQDKENLVLFLFPYAGGTYINEQQDLNDSKLVEEIMSSYASYEQVVSHDKYNDTYSLDVVEHDDYKTVTYISKDSSAHKVTFDLTPDFAYRLHKHQNGLFE